jgi:hypothetical protein
MPTMATEQHAARWDAADGTTSETLLVRFEHGGWTAEGAVAGLGVHYVVRLDPAWRVRQLLVFRDLDEPDLWLATDGAGGWGEVNGAVRDDLAGCTDAVIAGTPFVHTPPLRRAAGTATTARVAVVDVETLGVRAVRYAYEPVGEGRWSVVVDGVAEEVTVDGDGLVVLHRSFVRTA